MAQTPASLLPADEPERLRSLRAHNVLPALSGSLFEEFVARPLQVPVQPGGATA